MPEWGSERAMDDEKIGEVDSEDSPHSTHGKALCWVARITGIALSLLAAVYFLYHEVDLGSGWLAVPIAMWLLALSVAPSLLAWWSHRVGGAFIIIVCLLYAEGAYAIVDRADFDHVVLPFSALWATTGMLHLAVSWMEGGSGGTAHPP